MVRLSLTSWTLLSVVHVVACSLSNDALAKDDACSAEGGEACSAELLQVDSSSSSRRRSTSPKSTSPKSTSEPWVPTNELVSAVYTYGAPATHAKPFKNMASHDGCFPGLRAFTEDIKGVNRHLKQVDAASMNNFYPHAWTNTAVLHWGEDSLYVPCKPKLTANAEKKGHPDWPQRGGQVYEEWGLHQENDYTDRLNHMTVDGKDFTEQKDVKSSRHFIRMAFQSYDSPTNYKISLSALADPNWKLVEWVEDRNGDDVDPMMLVQDNKTLDCAIVFTGTNSFSEVFTSTTAGKKPYCGFEDVHHGYRNELWTLSKNLFPKLRPSLEKCNKVTAVGHSLGGALAELFGACANSGRDDDPDFQLLSWKKGKPEMMDEVDDPWATTPKPPR